MSAADDLGCSYEEALALAQSFGASREVRGSNGIYAYEFPIGAASLMSRSRDEWSIQLTEEATRQFLAGDTLAVRYACRELNGAATPTRGGVREVWGLDGDYSWIVAIPRTLR